MEQLFATFIIFALLYGVHLWAQRETRTERWMNDLQKKLDE